MTDRDFLIWLHERLVIVHKEIAITDYMHRLRAIIRSIPPDQQTPNNLIYNSIYDLMKDMETERRYEGPYEMHP